MKNSQFTGLMLAIFFLFPFLFYSMEYNVLGEAQKGVDAPQFILKNVSNISIHEVKWSR